MKILVLMIGLWLCMQTPAVANGSELQRICRSVPSGIVVRTIQEGIDGGRCAGFLLSLLEASANEVLKEPWDFCVPQGAGDQQAAKVVCLDNHPERLHQPAFTLAVVALQEAWPCPKAN